MESILMFALTLAGLGLCVGALIGAIICVPLLVYTIPYVCWLGWNSGSKGIPRKLESDQMAPVKGVFHYVKNATKLYRSWITKKPHGITKF